MTDTPRWELPLAALVSLLAYTLLIQADLSTPYWWDAAAVYVPGSKWVAENSFAAFPGVFPSLLARGHTTLFYVVTAVAYALFGTAPPVGHVVVLGFATLGSALTYALGARLFGRPAGVAAAGLLVVSPLWLTMSAQMLPEVPLAALTAGSLYAFSRGRHVEAAVWGVLVVLTKETGVACPLAITGALLLYGVRRRRFDDLVRPLLISLVPTVALAGFFVWQRLAEGWWVLPFHAELFGQEHDYLSQFGGVFNSMLLADGRVVALLGAVVLGLYRLRAAPESFAQDPHEAPSPSHPPRWVVLTSLVLVFLANQGFFTQMWFLERYALAAHPGLMVLLAGLLVPKASWPSRRLLASGAVVVLATAGLAVQLAATGSDYASGETTFRYLRMVEAHQRVYAVLESTDEPALVMTAWPMTEELRKPYLGWVSREYETVGIRGYRDGTDSVQGDRDIDAIVTVEGLGAHEDLLEAARELGMERVRREDVGGAVAELWARPGVFNP
ncbi:MAG: ArnT family glycosyltransferase [Sandaracinaceae bacterium]